MPKYCSYFEYKTLLHDYFTIHIKHPFKSLDKKIIHHDTMIRPKFHIDMKFSIIWTWAQYSVFCYVQ